MVRLLLASNSTNHGEGYLDHCMAVMREVLGNAGSLVFVPFALADQVGYGAKARARFAREGIAVDVLAAEPATGARQLLAASAVFVGGGNTFRLLRTLQTTGLLPLLRARALAGMPYLGASAGTNVATPSIRTTNDMPIVEPAGFAALGLVPFQINPHYLDPDPGSSHMGETREQRLAEFHEENTRRWWACGKVPGFASSRVGAPSRARTARASSAATSRPKSAPRAPSSTI